MILVSPRKLVILIPMPNKAPTPLAKSVGHRDPLLYIFSLFHILL
jgi:hypothetical protein